MMQAFPDEFSKLAVASVGFGSDRLGADDEYSRDHNWGPSFHIFSDRLSPDALSKIESYLYEHLPWDYAGFRRIDCPRSGDNGIRAWTIDEFFSMVTSFAIPPTQDRQWLLITDEALCHVTNGEVFHDPTGDLTHRREAFSALPDNVWRFKLAGRAMRISVQRYNAERCLAHGEMLAADLILNEGVREVLHFLCLVNRQHASYDKWLPWQVRRLPVLAGEIMPLISRMQESTVAGNRLTLYIEIDTMLASYIYDHGLAIRDQGLWRDLRQTITSDLKDFAAPTWVGVEYRYTSQCGIGDFRKLLTADGEADTTHR